MGCWKTWLLALAVLGACGETHIKSNGPGSKTPLPQNPGAFVCVPGTEPHVRMQDPGPGAFAGWDEFLFAGVDLPWRYSTAPDVPEATVGRLSVELWPGWGLLAAADGDMMASMTLPIAFDLGLENPGHNDCGVCVNLIIGSGKERRIFSASHGTLLVKQTDQVFSADLKGIAFRETDAKSEFLPDGCRPVLDDTGFSLPVKAL